MMIKRTLPQRSVMLNRVPILLVAGIVNCYGIGPASRISVLDLALFFSSILRRNCLALRKIDAMAEKIEKELSLIGDQRSSVEELKDYLMNLCTA
jgi:hypothetical protein